MQCLAEFQHVPRVRTPSWKHSSEEDSQLLSMHLPLPIPFGHTVQGEGEAWQANKLEIHL